MATLHLCQQIKKMFNNRTKIKALLSGNKIGQEVIVMGWIRTFRNNQFIALNDGSTNNNLQVVVELGSVDDETLKRFTTGASLKVVGELIASLGKGQTVELKAKTIEVLGDSDAEKYPLQPKKHSLEFLREKAHLRFRTNTFAAVFRLRHSLAYAIHKFYNDKGFVYLHTPIVTASDAEGAGEMFRVTTFDLNKVPLRNLALENHATIFAKKICDSLFNLLGEEEFKIINNKIKAINKDLSLSKLITARPTELQEIVKKNRKKFTAIAADFEEIYKLLKGLIFSIDDKGVETYGDLFVEILENRNVEITRRFGVKNYPHLSLSFFNFSKINNKVKLASDSITDIDYDFFGKSTNLTVSGQLEGELGAMAFSDIYTFGPTFRAENSNTARHLAEFWMIEPEVAFNDLEDNMDLAEEFIQYLIRYAMEHNMEDLEFLDARLAEEEKQKPTNERQEFGLIEKLKLVVDNKFERITYTEAIKILLDSKHYKNKKFKYDVSWGIDMQSEHERYLVEKHFKKPVIVTNYPAAIKAFYMRQDDGCEADKETVAAMDILAPGIGEIVGGSQREERLEKLEARMKAMHIPTEEMFWYLDTRRFGSVPHAGFGLGFERMVLFVTGMTNIRDVIPFARTPKNCEF